MLPTRLNGSRMVLQSCVVVGGEVHSHKQLLHRGKENEVCFFLSAETIEPHLMLDGLLTLCSVKRTPFLVSPILLSSRSETFARIVMCWI